MHCFKTIFFWIFLLITDERKNRLLLVEAYPEVFDIHGNAEVKLVRSSTRLPQYFIPPTSAQKYLTASLGCRASLDTPSRTMPRMKWSWQNRGLKTGVGFRKCFIGLERTSCERRASIGQMSVAKEGTYRCVSKTVTPSRTEEKTEFVLKYGGMWTLCRNVLDARSCIQRHQQMG